MRFLNKPNITHEEILTSCISNIEDKDLKTNVESLMGYFNEITSEYDMKGNDGELSQFETHESIQGIISKDQMKFLYGKLSTKGQPARDYYDQIKHSSSICPICAYRTSGTLDHYLPKSKFPVFSVNPLNLIPCCRDCNSIKRVDIPEIGKETLHPYFDNVEKTRWLYANVIKGSEVTFNFFILRPNEWPQQLYDKVNHHFSVFELSSLYSIVANSELNDQLYLLQQLFNIGGSEAVKVQLTEFHLSAQRHYLNHWKTAMYGALAESEWFCTEGIQTYNTLINCS